MRPTTRRRRFALGIFAILALGIVGVFGFGIYEEYAYVPGETFVIAPCEIDGRIALQVDGGNQARATGITIGGVTYDSSNVDRPIRLATYVQRWAWLPGADHRIVPAD